MKNNRLDEIIKKVIREEINETIRLYHCTDLEGFSSIVYDGYLDRKAYHKGECPYDVIWFSIKPSDYAKEVEFVIDVPKEKFRDRTFEWMNNVHAVSNENIPLNQYNLKLFKIKGVHLDNLWQRAEGNFDLLLDKLIDILGDGSYITRNLINLLLKQYNISPEQYWGEEDEIENYYNCYG